MLLDMQIRLYLLGAPLTLRAGLRRMDFFIWQLYGTTSQVSLSRRLRDRYDQNAQVMPCYVSLTR
jgi:hypothetical protein